MKKQRWSARIALMGCVGGILLIASSCLDKDDQNVVPIEVAYVSLYQASPNAPDLDIIVDNRQINSGPFNYAEYTGYLRFYTGQRNIRFGPFGASNVNVDTTLNLENGKAYSVFVVDEYENAGVLVLNDEVDAPAEGKAMVRFLNLSPDGGNVSLNAADNSTPWFADQAFKATSEFKEVDAKLYNLAVTNASGTGVLSVPDTDFRGGRYYTILVRGYQTPPAGNNHVLSAEVIVD